jgi:hypothetical protein
VIENLFGELEIDGVDSATDAVDYAIAVLKKVTVKQAFNQIIEYSVGQIPPTGEEEGGEEEGVNCGGGCSLI